MQNFWPIIIQTIKVEQYGNGVIISIKGLKLRAGALSICDKGSITLYLSPFQIRISRGSPRRTHGKSNVILVLEEGGGCEGGVLEPIGWKVSSEW